LWSTTAAKYFNFERWRRERHNCVLIRYKRKITTNGSAWPFLPSNFNRETPNTHNSSGLYYVNVMTRFILTCISTFKI
jgi:hypothetical protein